MLLTAIITIWDEFEAYGWRRVQAALRQQGVIANHKRIKRLMREHDLQPPAGDATDSNHDQPIFPDRARDMTPDGPEPAMGGGKDPSRFFKVMWGHVLVQGKSPLSALSRVAQGGRYSVN